MEFSDNKINLNSILATVLPLSCKFCEQEQENAMRKEEDEIKYETDTLNNNWHGFYKDRMIWFNK